MSRGEKLLREAGALASPIQSGGLRRKNSEGDGGMTGDEGIGFKSERGSACTTP
jgi:hypothetical protein